MEPFGQGDVVGMVLDYDQHKLVVSRNSMFLGEISLAGQFAVLSLSIAC
jgi:hypothetical protein